MGRVRALRVDVQRALRRRLERARLAQRRELSDVFARDGDGRVRRRRSRRRLRRDIGDGARGRVRWRGGASLRAVPRRGGGDGARRESESPHSSPRTRQSEELAARVTARVAARLVEFFLAEERRDETRRASHRDRRDCRRSKSRRCVAGVRARVRRRWLATRRLPRREERVARSRVARSAVVPVLAPVGVRESDLLRRARLGRRRRCGGRERHRRRRDPDPVCGVRLCRVRRVVSLRRHGGDGRRVVRYGR
mmetsp:Transcript_7490/g.31181  ORF Transcript_7490/g.31181 Transcript_7490/m.31181 type:complete len:252 (+) Transcript_7490:600-1355(+)